MWAALLFIAVPCRFDGRRVIGRSRCRSPGSIHKSAMARQRGNAGDTGRQSRPDERYKLNLWICVKCPNFCLYLRLSSPYATIWPVTGQPQAMADQCQPICTLCYRLCRFDVITRSVQIVDIFKIGSSHIMLKIKTELHYSIKRNKRFIMFYLLIKHLLLLVPYILLFLRE